MGLCVYVECVCGVWVWVCGGEGGVWVCVYVCGVFVYVGGVYVVYGCVCMCVLAFFMRFIT